MSDGTDYIFTVNGETLEVEDKVRVYDPVANTYVTELNELEFVKGYIYANVWYKDVLLKIDPQSGEVVKSWDLASLTKAEKAF